MKFLYITDTHIGGSDTKGYMQQKRYLTYLDELVTIFAEWIEKQGDVDFVIHGGDIVEKSSLENISAAGKLFQKLPCPTYCTLGNHDLTEDNSIATWLSQAPEFFNANSVDFSFLCDNVKLDFVSSHWGKKVYFWNPDEEQRPYLLSNQTVGLETEGDFRCKILITHAPVFGLPCGQTGLNEALHPPIGNFSDVVHELAKKHEILLVLGAHTHMNMHLCKDGVHYVTASAFSEMPFEFKVFELNSDIFSMETVNLADKISFKTNYNFNKTHIQGRSCDRSFKEALT